MEGTEDENENTTTTIYSSSTLFKFAEEGDAASLEGLLTRVPDLDLNITNRYGETSLHIAAGAGHSKIVSLLLSKNAQNICRDKRGDEPLHWAARQGHTEVIRCLKEHGANLNAQNKVGETPLNVAVRYGHLPTIEFLCSSGANVNLKDNQGEIPLHTVAWHGLPPEICQILCAFKSKVDTKNKEEEAPIHCAASRGNAECLKILISYGASVDIVDKRGCTPLHLACRRRNVAIAMILLHSGCQLDIVDQHGETPLHPACRENLLSVVQTMCAFGCKVDVINKGGSSPMHVASKIGHIEVVRCLLLSGATIDLPNKDGINAEILAIAQGQNEIADLLGKLKPEKQNVCIRQLLPSGGPLGRIKVKVLGSSGVGKTALIDALRCGLLGSLLRKAGLGSTSSSTIGTTNSTGQSPSPKIKEENGLTHKPTLETQLSFEMKHDGYTHGIDMHQVSLSVAGDLSIWEFSGYEPYYMIYDHFIGDPSCLHLVVIDLSEPQGVQLAQLFFWLNFIKVRMQPLEPIGFAGRVLYPAKVLLVGTHSDKVAHTSPRSEQVENSSLTILLETVMQKFDADLNIYPRIFSIESHSPMSAEMKALRTALSDIKAVITRSLPPPTGFLEAAISVLPTWRKVLASLPVVTWPSFKEYIRSHVNLLACEEHLKELIYMLQLTGEVVYVETEGDEDDFVVLKPRWLCGNLIGRLLSHDCVLRSHQSGSFTVDDIRHHFPDCSDTEEMLCLLESIDLCARCDLDDEVEYEFPCLNFMKAPGSRIWDREDVRFSEDGIFGGIRLVAQRGSTNQLMHVFPRIQVRLRRHSIQDREGSDDEPDFVMWYHGLKYCRGSLEILITMEQEEQALEVKCRGQRELASELYHFAEDVCNVIFGVIENCSPSLSLERHLLSPKQLSEYRPTVHAYIPKDVLLAQKNGHDYLTLTSGPESTTEYLVDVVAFGSDEIFGKMKPGFDLHVSHLSLNARRNLCATLDPPDPIGRDWCLLALSLGQTKELPLMDTKDAAMVSKTDQVLALWAQDAGATIRALVDKLTELGRDDAVDLVLSSAPMFRYIADVDEKTGDTQTSNDNNVNEDRSPVDADDDPYGVSNS